MAVISPESKARRLKKKICRRCRARSSWNAKKCRKCGSTNIRPKKAEKKVK